jgi:hypothetical protein
MNLWIFYKFSNPKRYTTATASNKGAAPHQQLYIYKFFVTIQLLVGDSEHRRNEGAFSPEGL